MSAATDFMCDTGYLVPLDLSSLAIRGERNSALCLSSLPFDFYNGHVTIPKEIQILVRGQKP